MLARERRTGHANFVSRPGVRPGCVRAAAAFDVTTVNDIHGLGLASAQDTLVVLHFLGLNDESRA